MANSGGGVATNAGVEFQQRVSAWFAVAMLKGLDIAYVFEIESSFIGESMSWETSACIDDLLLRSKDRSIFVQVKRSIELSAAETSEFRSVLVQFISRFLAHGGTENYALIVSPLASRSISNILQKLLLSIRLDEQGYADNPRSKKEAEVFAIFRQGVESTFLALAKRPITENEFVQFCKRMLIVSMAVEANGPDERVAIMLLQSISRIGLNAQLVWSSVIAQCLRFATGRICCKREPLERIVFAALPLPVQDSSVSEERFNSEEPTLASSGRDVIGPKSSDGPKTPLKLFLSYAHADAHHRATLERHLSPLIRSGRIILWHDRKIAGGVEWASEIDHHLESADLILLLVSASFMASNYCWDVEFKRAMERHDAGDVRVVPIFVEPCYWKGASFARLQGFPRDGKAVTEGVVERRYAEVAQEIAGLLDSLESSPTLRLTTPRGFDRELYLRSLLARLEQIEDEALFSPESYIELEKDVATPAVESYSVAEHDEFRPPHVLERNLRQLVRRTQRSLFQLLRESRTGRVLALLGEPGSGKSVLMRRLARDLVQAALKNPQAPLPMYFSLGTYTQSLAGKPVLVEDFIREMLLCGPVPERGLAPLLDENLAAGRLILLFDGMDEMPRTDFSARVTELRELMQRQTLCRILISCRINDFPRGQLKVHQVRLAPLGPTQIRSFLSQTLNISWWSSGGLIRRLLAHGSPLAGLATNPLFLTLLGRYLVAHGNLPPSRAELFQSFVDPHLERVLSRRPEVERSTLLNSLGRLGLAMLDCAGIGTAVPIHRTIQQAGFEPEEGARWIDLAQLTGLVKRDDVTGALRFLHPRLQEFFAALALSQSLFAERECWLRSNIDNPWLEEVYILLAQRGVELSAFFGTTLDEVEANLKTSGIAAERSSRIADDFTYESRLILLGRMLDAARLSTKHVVVTRMAELLVQLERTVGEHPLPELRWRRLLRAVRGPLISHPQLARRVDIALNSAETWKEEAAFKALANSAASNVQVRRKLTGYVIKQVVQRDMLLNSNRLDECLADEPKLMDLRRLISLAFLGHVFLIVLVMTCWAKAWVSRFGTGYGTLSIFVSIIFYTAQFSRRRHRPVVPSALVSQILVLLFHAAALLAWTSIDFVSSSVDWFITDHRPDYAVVLHSLGFSNGSATALTCSLLMMLVAAFWPRLVSWLAPLWKALLWGIAAGLLICVFESIWAGLPLWTLVWMCMTGATAFVIFSRLSLNALSSGRWVRRGLLLVSAMVFLLLMCLLPFVLVDVGTSGKQHAFMPHVFDGGLAKQLLQIVQYALLVLQALLGLAALGGVLWLIVSLLGNNLGAILLARSAPPGPFRLAQLSLALRVLTSSLVVLEARKAAIRNLGEMEPPSEALVLALLEYSRSKDGRVEDRPEIAKAVDELQERLRREPVGEDRLGREIPILATITKAWRARDMLCQTICKEWMSRLGLGRGDLEANAGRDNIRHSAEEVLRHIGPPERPAVAENVER